MRIRFNYIVRLCLTCLVTSLPLISVNASEYSDPPGLTLEDAVSQAILNDPWLVSNQHQQAAIESMSLAAATLPDPKMNIGIANIAADSFDFNQEAMTQFKVGISQMFPRGDSLAIKKKQLEITASQYPLQRKDRQAKVAVIVSNLWLEAYKAQQSISLIEQDRTLFEQLADVALANYSSALGKTRQQDIVRAQLELTQLDDRLTQLKQKKEMAQQQLSEWLNKEKPNDSTNSKSLFSKLSLAKSLPNIKMVYDSIYKASSPVNQQTIYQYLSTHPSVMVFDKKIEANKTAIELEEQKYKPEWGVNAGYGVRDDSPMGMPRSDLFSIGVSFDIPLFTNNRQDKLVESAISKTAATKTDKWLFIRNLIASIETKRIQLSRLTQRQALYQERLIPQMHNQAQASLTAYTNDDGDFAEVVRSRIAELNASIDALSIDIEKQKTIIQLNYFFMKKVSDITLEMNQSVPGKGENNEFK